MRLIRSLNAEIDLFTAILDSESSFRRQLKSKYLVVWIHHSCKTAVVVVMPHVHITL